LGRRRAKAPERWRMSAAARGPVRFRGRRYRQPVPCPRSKTWPGLRRKNVMLSRALTAAPMIVPFAPLMPLGRSTATIGAPLAFIVSMIARASPSTRRLRPAPNSASTMTPEPAMASGDARSIGRAQSRAASAASPRSAATSSKSSTRTGKPRSARTRAAMKPSPPLLPGPATTTTRVPRGWRATVSATARPAFSISAMPAVPAAIVRRSHSAISSGVSSSIMSRLARRKVAQKIAGKQTSKGLRSASD